MMKLVVAVVALAAVATAIPSRCSSPKQWSARAMIFDQDSQRGTVADLAEYFYDETEQMKARFDHLFVNGSRLDYHVIEDFNSKTAYIINLKDKSCSKEPLKMPFIPHGVPKDGEFQGEFYLGSSAVEGAYLEATAWTDKFDNQGETIYWNGQFTLTACVPLNMAVQGKDFYRQENFFDVSLGIIDPNVFVIPPNC
eukprot:m.351337 g.351337  ORF g.351337 m.351337 type:complete len:196 (-) comp16228_c0_seq1:142-729(-)